LALFFAVIYKLIGNNKEKSEFILELPTYQNPRIQTVISQAWIKCRTFLSEAGKVIIVISMILWALSSFGPKEAMKTAHLKAVELTKINKVDSAQIHNTQKLEASYAGHLGKFIEPAIKPLGFDWKIGISLVTSFAAREVFVGTMATIYSVGADEENTQSIREKMNAAKNPETGEKSYTLAVAVALMLFYAFSMQCMSTIAVVYRETKSWKIPLLQFLYMGSLAYFASYVAYNWLK
jgi:ferrous iron transport protein B